MKVRISIDGRDVTVEEGRDLLTTCLEQGADVPHFCWHGALGSVGACRLCAVRVFDGPEDTQGRIEMSCMTPVREGQRVEVADPEAAEFRARVIEWLMLNHPHDCAVCEEGGACHLQDMTVLTGHHNRRARVEKRTHRNQDLGPLLTHEMNRCIACYRCTRFYRGYAGGRDLDVFGAHDRVYFGRATDGVLESPFAGNLAEICPTGVFTDKGWSRNYARRWDMNATPSVCPHCAVGCNITLFERHGSLRQVQNRYHGQINGFFLCDRGRFGPWFVASDRRIETARHQGRDIGPAEAVDVARAMLAAGAIGIGSPRASLEANFALRRLVGANRFFAGVGSREVALVRRIAAVLRAGPARIATLKDMETAGAALVLGEDLTGTAPRAALALRQAARGASRALAAEKGVPDWLDNAVRVAGEGRRSPIMLVTPTATDLDDIANVALRRSPDDVTAFGFAVAASLRGERVDDADAVATARALAAAKDPLVVAGAGLGCGGPIEAAAAVAAALGARARIALFPPEVNSMGLALLGGDGLEGAVAALRSDPRPVVVLENDLFERAAAGTVEQIFDAATAVVVLDSLETRCTARADLVLPAASFAEAAGTVVNHEGRAQRGFAAIQGAHAAPWRVLSQLGGGLFRRADGAAEVLDDVLDALAAECPDLAPAVDAAPRAASAAELGLVARSPARWSGRTASDLAGRVAGAVLTTDPDSPLAWTMEGSHGGEAPAALSTGSARAGLHSVSAAYLAQETIGGPLKGGDPGALLLTAGAGSNAAIPGTTTPKGTGTPGLVLVPLHDPFSATETDRASDLLAARAPGPRLVLNPDDAARLGLSAGDAARVDGAPCAAPVSLDARMLPGHVGLSVSLAAPRGQARRVKVEAVS
jgi:NADH-quinone oxidoreductase subunit G